MCAARGADACLQARQKRTSRSPFTVAFLAGVIGFGFVSACSAAPGRPPAASAVVEETSTTLPPPRTGAERAERLPPVDRTSALSGLVEADAASPRLLAIQFASRLSAFLGTDAEASVAQGELTEMARPEESAGSTQVVVIEVRYRDRRGDDKTPGYDLLVEMTRSSSGRWAVERIEEVTVCSRGAETVDARRVCR